MERSLNAGKEKLSQKGNFREMGLDSLAVVDMVVEMEQSIGIDISNEEAERITSIESAVEVFSQHLHRRIDTSSLE